MSVLFYLISFLIALCGVLTVIIYMETCNNNLSVNEGFESSKEIPLELNPDYLNNNVIDKKPNFKLDAYCINLNNKIQNMNFIENTCSKEKYDSMNNTSTYSNSNHLSIKDFSITFQNLFKSFNLFSN